MTFREDLGLYFFIIILLKIKYNIIEALINNAHKQSYYKTDESDRYIVLFFINCFLIGSLHFKN